VEKTSKSTRFFGPDMHKTEKNMPIDPKLYQTAINYTKWLESIPNGHIIHRTTSSVPGFSKMYPNCFFWFEYKPSGNPGLRFVAENGIVDISYQEVARRVDDEEAVVEGREAEEPDGRSELWKKARLANSGINTFTK
jgi:hypothetical protein